MAKVLKKVMIQIEVTKDGTDVSVVETAHLTVSTEEYPDFEMKKGITVSLTSTQEAAIINHVKDIVLPQAELAK